MFYASTPRVLGVLVAVITLAFLVGARFDARFAGGEARNRLTFTSVDAKSSESCASADDMRQHFVTCEGQYKTVSYRWAKGAGGADILLDEKSDVSVVNDRQGEDTFGLVTGRIVVHSWGPVTITVRDTRVIVDGTATLVNYSWKDQLDVRAIDGSVTVEQNGTVVAGLENRTVTLDTLAPYDAPRDAEFHLDADNVRDFYSWVQTSNTSF